MTKIKSWLGATVRLLRGKRTAIVTCDLVIGNNVIAGGVKLNKRLGGCHYWNIEDLVYVSGKPRIRCDSPACLIEATMQSTTMSAYKKPHAVTTRWCGHHALQLQSIKTDKIERWEPIKP